jgi:hypothetical protein
VLIQRVLGEAPQYHRTRRWKIGVLFTPGSRRALLREGWNAELRVIGLGVVMDVIYQFMVFGMICPFELVVIVLALAFVPYVIVRGPINRIARAWITGKVRT